MIGIILVIGVVAIGAYLLMNSGALGGGGDAAAVGAVKANGEEYGGGEEYDYGYSPPKYKPRGYGFGFPIPPPVFPPSRLRRSLGLPRPHLVPPYHHCHPVCNIAKNEMACVQCLHPHGSECYAECMIARNDVACDQCMSTKSYYASPAAPPQVLPSFSELTGSGDSILSRL